MRVLEGLDNAAAEDAIISIEDCGLSRAQGALWLVKENAKGAL
jgi:hypothetical protein